MASYDSDSSGAEDDYTETNVLLGYATKESTGDTISHLGGQPDWIDTKTQPSGSFAKCKICNSYLSLLLQLNGDLPEHFPGHERRLYVWSCRRKACRRKEGSIRAIRGVRISKDAAAKAQQAKAPPKPEPAAPKPQPMLGESLFGAKPSTGNSSNTNPFSTSSSSGAPRNPFSSPSSTSNPFATSSLAAKPPQPLPSQPTTDLPETFASKVRISSPSPEPAPVSSPLPARPHEPWPQLSAFPPTYPTYNLDADYETLDAPKTESIPAHTRMDIDGESSGAGGGKEDKEVFESTLDKTFQKFADRMAQNPEQVLRYEFRGAPLLYSKTDAVYKALGASAENANAKVQVVGGGKSGMPRCASCGAERVFEVQLTPHAITELEAEEEGLEGMEWGTVVVGVCAKDCKPRDVAVGDVGYVEEWVGVQWEEVKK